MQDNLRKYIQDSRDEFEVYQFEGRWDDIKHKSIPNKRNVIDWKGIMAIAASIFVAVIGSNFYQYYGSNQSNSELTEIEHYYASEINQMVSMIKSKPSGVEVLADFEAMDQAFGEVKNDLKDNIDNEEVVMAMMEKYRLKLEILERIVQKLEKEENEQTL